MTDIYATAIDYDAKARTTCTFFATAQNKLHYATREHARGGVRAVDRDKPLVGMTNFSGDYVTREDVGMAKNYLTEKELW